MTKLSELQLRQSEIRERINALLSKEDRTEEETTELREATDSAQQLEPEIRAALVIEDEADKLAREASPDPELRERMELRGRVSFARYLNVNARGGLPDGAEGELNAACKVPGAAIPFDVWEPTLEQRQREQRALTPAPSTGHWRQRAADSPGDLRPKYRAHVADRSSDGRIAVPTPR